MDATRVRNKIKRGRAIYAEKKGLGMRLRVIYKCDCAACQLRAVGLVLSMADTRATKEDEKIVATGRMCNVVTGGGRSRDIGTDGDEERRNQKERLK